MPASPFLISVSLMEYGVAGAREPGYPGAGREAQKAAMYGALGGRVPPGL